MHRSESVASKLGRQSKGLMEAGGQGVEAQRGGWRGVEVERKGKAESKEWQSWPIGSEGKQFWSYNGLPLALPSITERTCRSPPPPPSPTKKDLNEKSTANSQGALSIVQARVDKDLGQWWWGYRGGDSPGAFLI